MNKQSVYIFNIGYLGDTLVSLPAIYKIREFNPGRDFFLITNTPRTDGYVTSWNVLKHVGYFKGVFFYEPASINSLIGLTLKLRSDFTDRSLYYLIPTSRSRWQAYRDYFFFKVLCNFEKIYGINESISKNIIRNNSNDLVKTEKESKRLLKNVYSIHNKDFKESENPKAPLLSIPSASKERAKRLLKGLQEDVIWIAVGHSSMRPATRWDINKFKELFKLLVNYSKKIHFILLGGKEDFESGEYLRSNFAGHIINLCGKTNIIESAAAISKSVLYIGNDTGIMHLAASMDIPCVCIFSARNNPGKWEPYGNRHVILRKDIDCAGCFLDECIEKKNRCMEMINIEEVFKAVISQLEKL
ncbi:MAG: hypothetical protein A2X55_04960 [Nitrospirae bacterium GWB2_47_37]|nr:MAG: hypothetical protein A2X55_04960 [Nitrospirae bacterium GWB2_47_37]